MEIRTLQEPVTDKPKQDQQISQLDNVISNLNIVFKPINCYIILVTHRKCKIAFATICFANPINKNSPIFNSL